MVLGTALVEVIGTVGDDTIALSPNVIHYGINGNDTFVSGSGFMVQIGGSGSDQYGPTDLPYVVLDIDLGNSPGDRVVDNSLNLSAPTTSLFVIDGRHFAGIDPVANKQFYLLDIFLPENTIETTISPLGTFTFEEFQTIIPFDQLPNLTWDDVLQLSPLFAQVGLDSAAKINEFIDYLKVRAVGLEVTEGADVLVGTPGNDTLNGLGGNDQINGDAGDDVLLGDADNDRLFGDAGNDTLFGGDGKDKLFGGDGDDLLFGGEGIDQMNGQDGSDIHVLQLGDGYARIKGFDPSTDKLGFVKGEVRLAQLDLSTRSGSAVLAIDNDILGGTLGVGLDELTRRNVVFVKQSEVIG